MTKRLFPLIFLLAACGVDGPPVPPNQVDPDEDSAGPSVLISGNAAAGLRVKG